MRAVRRAARTSRRGCDGQIIITFAFTFMFFLFGMIALVADLATLYANDSVLRKAAEDGAIAGAADVNTTFFTTTGVVQINASAVAFSGTPGAGTNPCSQAIFDDVTPLSGVTATCTVTNTGTGGSVTVTVQRSVGLPIPFGAGTITESRSYTAAGECGANTTTTGKC